MPEYSFSTVIDGPVDTVFGLVSELDALPGYVRDIEAIVPLDAKPTGVGTCFLHRRRLFGRSVERLVTITEWSPPHRFVASFEAAGTIVHSVHVFDRSASGSVFTLTLAAQPSGFRWLPGHLLWMMMLPAISRGVRREVDDVRARVELASRTTAGAGTLSAGVHLETVVDRLR